MTTSNHPSSQQAKLVSLYKLVDEMLTDYIHIKKNRRKIFINEVPRNLAVSASKKRTDPDFADLFAIISSDPASGCVRISARRTDNVVKLYVKKSEIRGFSFSGIRIHAA